MNQQFYIAVNGQQTGPFSYDELKAKGIRHDTLIWTEGLDSWTKAEYIALVKDILRATPPPLPNEEKKQQAPPPPPTSSPQQTGKYFGYELATRRERFFAMLVETIILFILYLLFFGGTSINNEGNSFGSIVGATISSAIMGAIFYSMWSGNLGHKIIGLKVISSVDGSDQNKAFIGALREGLKNLFAFVLFPIIWLLWDFDRQNLYDKVLKTYVVKKKPAL